MSTEMNEDPAQLLADFKRNNPEAGFKEEKGVIIVTEPWGDESVQLHVSRENKALLKALNSLRLPPRYSALHHLDSNDIEFIYVPFDTPEKGRRFTFQYGPQEYVCEYADPSEKLWLIAKTCEPLDAPSDTFYRNLLQFGAAAEVTKQGSCSLGERHLNEGTSFYIRNYQATEEDLLEVAKHLNFYMKYYDSRTPKIAIHPDKTRSRQAQPKQERYPHGSFPLRILGRELDSYGLTLWSCASSASDCFRRFLYNYQILEYFSFYSLRESIKSGLKHILVSPESWSDPNYAVRNIIELMADTNQKPADKFDDLVRQTTDFVELKAELERYNDYFKAKVPFEGGYTVDALLHDGETTEAFIRRARERYPKTLRDIRNSIVHARELRRSECISPTARNEPLLRPWLSPIAMSAKQALLQGVAYL